MTTQTFYWHDYETFGLDPQRDRPAQFAGVRTDADFNVIAKPLVVYCKPAADTLPHPDSCLITGITPQLAEQKGVCEADFIRLIHEQLAQPNTCTLGYNNLRFDDEVTRNTLYRNFYDPYAREWQNGNSRWDLIDAVRAARALRPEGIQWVNSAEGKPSFRLDQLTIANNIAHQGAHDALADVYATIELAKLLKQAQPKLFQFLLENRVKTKVSDLLQLGSFKPVIHISGKYPAAKNCLAVVLPLCKHPTDNNGVIVYDLSINSEPMLTLSATDIQKNIFTATANLPEGTTRIPLKTVHINRCPVLAPVSVLKPDDAQRLTIDLVECFANIAKISTATDLTQKLREVFGAYSEPQNTDPDLAIYSGGFFADADKASMTKIRFMSAERLANSQFSFSDKRLTEMLFRYRARNYPDTLTAEEQQKWQTFCVNRLTGQQAGAGITFADYFARLNELKTDEKANQETIQALETYGLEKKQQLGMTA
jgi:exodeoxyribonuclease-1